MLVCRPTCFSNFTLSLYDLHFEGCCSTKQSCDLTRAFRFLLFLTTILTSPGCTAAYIRGNSSGTFVLESTAETRTLLPSVKHSSWLKHPMNYRHHPETSAAQRCSPNPTHRAASHQLHQCTCLGWHVTRRENRRFQMCTLKAHHLLDPHSSLQGISGSAEIRIRKVMPQKTEKTLKDQVAQVNNVIWKGFSWDSCQVAGNWYEFFPSQTWPWYILFGKNH